MRKSLATATLVLLGTVLASDASAQLWRGRGRVAGTVTEEVDPEIRTAC